MTVAGDVYMIVFGREEILRFAQNDGTGGFLSAWNDSAGGFVLCKLVC